MVFTLLTSIPLYIILSCGRNNHNTSYDNIIPYQLHESKIQDFPGCIALKDSFNFPIQNSLMTAPYDSLGFNVSPGTK